MNRMGSGTPCDWARVASLVPAVGAFMASLAAAQAGPNAWSAGRPTTSTTS